METLADLIGLVPDGADAIALPWRLFGAAGQETLQDALTPSRFRHAAPDPFFLPAGSFFKTLHRPISFQKLGVHRARKKPGSNPHWNLGGAQAAPDGFAENDNRINLFGLMHKHARARLNHYSLRSAGEFMVKRGRGLPNRMTKRLDLHYWAERNFNTVRDAMIDPMLVATRAELARLIALPDVAAAHEVTVRWHRNAFATLMTDAAEVQFYWHLILLGNSTPPNPEQVRAHLLRHAGV